MAPSQMTLDIGFAHDRTTGKEDWLTPPYILRALGQFDLDPCAPEPRPWDMAAAHFTIHQNGLNQPWHGRVWLNPPYGNETDKWMRRLAEHGDGIALIFARTETATFHPWVWDYAEAMLFLKGRIRFYTREGREGGASGAPSVLVAYGRESCDMLRRSGLSGKFIAVGGDRVWSKPLHPW
jgi:DNA N-6-adenine-methyltransferase (Dam)